MIQATSTVGDMFFDDEIMIVARAWKEIRGSYYVKNMRFCYDEYDQCVYVLAFEDGQPSLFRGYQVKIGTGNVVMSQVKSIICRNNSESEYIDIPVVEKVCLL